jgi:hypothetical protein
MNKVFLAARERDMEKLCDPEVEALSEEEGLDDEVVIKQTTAAKN